MHGPSALLVYVYEPLWCGAQSCLTLGMKKRDVYNSLKPRQRIINNHFYFKQFYH